MARRAVWSFPISSRTVRVRRAGSASPPPCGSAASLFGTLAIGYRYTAAGGDEGSYLLIRKMALVGQATIHAPSPMQFSG
jgi:hypothetical protein